MVYNCFMNTNVEILNYLNLVNERLGKLYKLSGFNPLPDDFVFNKKVIKERLFLNQMQSEISFPDFVFGEKKYLKKHFKYSIKNIRNLLKNKELSKVMSTEFQTRFSVYLTMRESVTALLLKDFNKFYFNECDAYAEIFNINPVMFNLLTELFEKDCNLELLIEELETKYKTSYEEKLKAIEAKTTAQEIKKKENTILELENERANAFTKNKEEIKNHKLAIKNEKKAEKTKKHEEVKKVKTSIANKEK